MSAPNGCSGGCCVAFHFSATHENLADGVLVVREVEDAERLMNMLVPITREEAEERHDRFGTSHDLRVHMIGEPDRDDANLYKCANWNEETRLCEDYANRPSMCQDYPYEKECPGCTCKSDPDVVEAYIEIRAQREIADAL